VGNLVKIAWPRYGAQSAADLKASLALAKTEKEETPPKEPWTGEPESLEQLLDRYILEAKFSARTAGATLYLMQSRARDGTVTQCTEHQKLKLFIAPRCEFQRGNNFPAFVEPPSNYHQIKPMFSHIFLYFSRYLEGIGWSDYSYYKY